MTVADKIADLWQHLDYNMSDLEQLCIAVKGSEQYVDVEHIYTIDNVEYGLHLVNFDDNSCLMFFYTIIDDGITDNGIVRKYDPNSDTIVDVKREEM